jgi:hypothetical protein
MKFFSRGDIVEVDKVIAYPRTTICFTFADMVSVMSRYLCLFDSKAQAFVAFELLNTKGCKGNESRSCPY